MYDELKDAIKQATEYGTVNPETLARILDEKGYKQEDRVRGSLDSALRRKVSGQAQYAQGSQKEKNAYIAGMHWVRDAFSQL